MEKISHCSNCQSELQPGDVYCSNCGQRVRESRITAWQLIKTFFASVFNIESKALVTFTTLFKPGRLTAAYFKGRRQSFVHPIRFLLFTALVAAAAISTALSDNEPDLTEFSTAYEKHAQNEEYLEQVDQIIDSLKVTSPELDTASLDSLRHQFAMQLQDNVADSIQINRYVALFNYKNPPIAIDDFINAPLDEIISKYKIEGWLNQFQFKQKVKLLRNTTNFIRFAVGRIAWAIFITIPIVALAFKLIYIRRGYFYVEHLIFLIHIHCLFFLVVTLSLFAIDIIPPWLHSAIRIFFSLYIVLAIRFFYQQSWLKTIVKSILILFAYLLSLGISLVITVLLTILIY